MIPKTPILTTFVFFGLLLVLTSCSSIVRREAPSLSHVHIGHAVTAWEPAPNKQGLLVAAELYCIEAKANSDLMLEAAANGQLSEMKYHLSNIASLVDPTLVAQSSNEPYGLRKLMAESVVHLKVASEIFDASPNVRRTMAEINVRGEKISSKIDELQIFLELALESENVSEMKFYSEEISRLLTTIGGQPADESTYGIQQFHEDIAAMIAREDPPYQTIDKLYLFSIGI